MRLTSKEAGLAPCTDQPRLSWLLPGRHNRLGRVKTKSFAVTACFGANPAVLVLLRVAFAFIATSPAGYGTRFQHGTERRFVTTRAARGERAACSASIRTVKIEADALGKFRDHILAQASVGTGYASLFAVKAGFDTVNQNVVRVASDMWMGGDHLLDVHGCLL